MRTLRAFAAARVLLGALLLGLQLMLAAVAGGALFGPRMLVQLAQVLAAAALLIWVHAAPAGKGARWTNPFNRHGYLRRSWMLASIGVDVLAFALLLQLAGDSGSTVALFSLPLLMSAVLLTRRWALAVTSFVVLLLLAHAAWLAVNAADAASLIGQAGITGAGMLMMVVLTGELADRLAHQERAARSTLMLARQQAQLNRLMIDEMHDGVMVVDSTGAVRAGNPAALALIGAPRSPEGWVPFDLKSRPGWRPLWTAVEKVYAEGRSQEGGEEVVLESLDGRSNEKRHLRLRLRLTRQAEPEAGEALCLLLVDDVRMLRARARQDQLAAMGRMSAGIAHEIRNPLAAIGQANALLLEDLSDPAHERLGRMVADNVKRLQRIVDDVLQAAPGAVTEAPVIDLRDRCRALSEDWMRTAGLTPGADGSPVLLDLGREARWARFEVDHLQRVLVNLLDNAWRHCSGQAHAIWVRLSPLDEAHLTLSVASDGDPIAADVEPYLFEPFFSTRSRGSGLGLYICRELCERHGALLEYRSRGPGARHRNVFVVTLPRMPAPSSADAP